jgi:hypothetical protein
LDLAPIADRLHRGQPMANAPHLLRGGTKFAKLEQITLRLDDRFRRQMSASEKLMHWVARVIP